MRTLCITSAMLFVAYTFAQTSAGIETKKFYDALNAGDSLAVLDFLSEDLVVTHYEYDTVYSFNLREFMTIIPKFRSGKFRENFVVTHESGYPGTDIVDVDFAFYLDGEHDHCGKDVVVWKSLDYRLEPAKITEIHSYQSSCDEKSNVQLNNQDQLIQTLNQMMDSWHEAAAKANFKAFFDFMADDFYYLGTDPKERWSREQFANFCRPYFDKGKAWTFKAIERNFYFSEDNAVVWFDEKLDTWMEECRGSGVIVFEKMSNGEKGWSNWKLKHYNLTVTIENDKIKDFIKLRQE